MSTISTTYQAYYTKSAPILNYMTKMLHFTENDNVLEPCGGDGVFVDKILEIQPTIKINVLELNPKAVVDLRNKYTSITNVSIRETDTLLDKNITSCVERYEKIIGNPPYGARTDEKKKDLLNQLYPNMYTKESYTLFLYACIRCLKENGELCFIVPDTFLSLHRHDSVRKYILANTKIKEIALFPSSFFPGVNFGYANLCIITLIKSSNITDNLNNRISVKTNFNSVEELNAEDKGTQKYVAQKSIYERVGSSFMFNSTDEITDLINNSSLYKIGDIANCVTGFYSGNDKKYLHPLNENIKNAKRYNCANEVNIREASLTQDEKTLGISSEKFLVPIVKGGNVEYVKPNYWFMDWSSQAIKEYKTSKKCRFQNSDFYFKNGIGVPMIRSTKLTGALIEGRLFDQSIVGVFPKNHTYIYYLLGFFNSSICTELINAINPSTNNSANYIKKIPFIVPCNKTRKQVETLVVKIIGCLKTGNSDTSLYKEELDAIFSNLYLKKDGIEMSQESKKRKLKQLNLFDTFEDCIIPQAASNL